MKNYISKVLLSIFCILPLFTCEFLLPLYAEETWNEKLFDRDNRESRHMQMGALVSYQPQYPDMTIRDFFTMASQELEEQEEDF